MNKDQAEGKAKEIKGSIKESAGKAMNDRETEAEGKADQVEGKAQKAVGDVKDAAS